MSRPTQPSAISDAKGYYLKHPDRKPAGEPVVTKPLGGPPKHFQDRYFDATVEDKTLHTTDDDTVPVQDEQAYVAVVAGASHSSLLRQTFVHHAGHCSLTAAETIAALLALIQRLDTGSWQGLDPEDLNTAATRLGAAYNASNGRRKGAGA